MHVNIITLYVNDQKKAKEFYTTKLGFTVKQDADYGNGGRWLTVVSPNQPDVEVGLFKPELDEQRQVQEAMYKVKRPFMSFATDNLQQEYETLKQKGVPFISEPQKRPYGGFDAVFDDTCGNIINLHQA